MGGNTSSTGKVVIDCEPSSPVNFEKPFLRKFTIRNWNLRQALPVDTKLCIVGSVSFQPSFVFVGEIPPGGSKVVNLEHLVNKQIEVNLSNIEEVTTYALVHGEDETLCKVERAARMYEYAGFLAERRPTNPEEVFNVLFYGPKGCGKSSLIASIFSAMDPKADVLLNVAQINALAAHCTRMFRKYVPPAAALPNVHIWDTWGETPSSYQPGDLAKLVSGFVPDGTEMKGVAGIEIPEAKQPPNKMHAIVVFIPCASIPDAAGLLQNGLRLAEEMKQAGLNAVFLLARCDEQLPDGVRQEYLKNPNRGYPKLEEMKELVSKKVGYPLMTVFHTSPYVRESKKIFERDRLFFMIMDRALNAAVSFEGNLRR